jgi:hypothetical protein
MNHHAASATVASAIPPMNLAREFKKILFYSFYPVAPSNDCEVSLVLIAIIIVMSDKGAS